MKVEIKYLLINSLLIHSNNNNNNLIAYNNLSSPALLVTTLLRSVLSKTTAKKIPSQSHFNFNLEFLKPLKKQLYEVRNENEKKCESSLSADSNNRP